MGDLAPLFSVFFFIMMLALGFGSEFSIMESVMSKKSNIFQLKTNTKAWFIYIHLILRYNNRHF